MNIINRFIHNKKMLSFMAVVIAFLSIFCIAPIMERTTAYPATVTTLDKNNENIEKLAGAAAITSTLITAIPDDTATPIAEEIADFTTYFLIILTALYFEKNLLVITAFIAYRFLVPIGCCYFIYGTWKDKLDKKILGGKFIAFAIILNLLIPGSTYLSRMVESNYQDTVEETLSLSEETEKIFSDMSDEDNIMDKITALYNGTTEYLKNVSNSFINSVAIMVVTSIIIPIITLILFYFIIKFMFGLELRNPSYYYKHLLDLQKKTAEQ